MDRLQVNERSQLPVTISLTVKQTGVPSTPNTLKWRMDCLTTNQAVVPETALGASSTVELTIPATSNVIIHDENPYETKRITVTANAGTSLELNSFLDFDVLNNRFYV